MYVIHIRHEVQFRPYVRNTDQSFHHYRYVRKLRNLNKGQHLAIVGLARSRKRKYPDTRPFYSSAENNKAGMHKTLAKTNHRIQSADKTYRIVRTRSTVHPARTTSYKRNAALGKATWLRNARTSDRRGMENAVCRSSFPT